MASKCRSRSSATHSQFSSWGGRRCQGDGVNHSSNELNEDDFSASTTGGTSDGRFIAKICPQVVEFGPINASIHKIDEHVLVADIERLKNIYRRTLENLLT